MVLGGEISSVQRPLIEYAKACGWTHIKPEEVLDLRGGKTHLILEPIFKDQMRKLNAFIDSGIADDLRKKIENVPPTIEGNLISWEYFKGRRTVFVDAENRERNATIFDVDNVDNNTFHVTEEFSFTSGTKTIRLDVVLIINGIPVLFAEAKAPHVSGAMNQALDQVKRYQRECPEVMAVQQLYFLTHVTRFLYSSTWNTSARTLYDWRDESTGSFEELAKSFLDPKRVIKTITEHILFTRQDDELRKVILRPHQMRAVDSVICRAKEDKKRGLIWHTQGSGKTYTMIVAAKKILDNPEFNNPTVLLLVDRNELESQLFNNLDAVGIKDVVRAERKEHIRTLLRDDYRGLIVSMIHKFEDMPANVSIRDNIYILIDEAHRTTGGSLGNYLMGALPNATYIGFTGTPIDKSAQGQGTFVTFGQQDPYPHYLDKYSIAQSIEDKTTVPINYTLSPSDLQVDRLTLEKEFLDLKDTEGITDIEELNRILSKATNLKNILKSRDRMEKVAAHAAKHFQEYVEPLGYKAFLVAVDREACGIYKTMLDKHLPPEYSEVVYSRGANDSEELASYHLSAEDEKQVRKDFRSPQKQPKILIVTEKLLTGYDAPILYCMYLDKPMRDHVLLQAIARVNRPYEDERGAKKPSGMVLDYVGILGNLKKALQFDSSDIEGVVNDLEALKKHFAKVMTTDAKEHLHVTSTEKKDKAIEHLLEQYRDQEVREKFYKFFREVQDIYEILSPDEFLRPYLDDYNTLARMNRIIKEAYDPSSYVNRELLNKTKALVEKHVYSGPIKESLKTYSIDEHTLRKIAESNKSAAEKVFNLIKSLEKEVTEKIHEEPYLLSIGEKAEKVANDYKQRLIDAETALVMMEGLVKARLEAKDEKEASGMEGTEFSIYWLLKAEGITNSKSLAKEMAPAFAKYQYWRSSEAHERELRRELYAVPMDMPLSERRKLFDKLLNSLWRSA